MSNEYIDYKGQILGIDNNGNTIILRQDNITKAIKIISSDHANIHQGEGFSISANYTSVLNNGVAAIEFKTPTDKTIHLKMYTASISGASAFLEFIESPTLTTGITQITPSNRNRISTNLSKSILKSNPTSITGGTVIESFYFGGGGNGINAPSGMRSLDVEFLLKQDTTYLFKTTNLSGSAINVSIFIFWYEEE